MRPGSAELIEHYRTLADRGEPLAPDPDHLIPHRPGEAEAMQRINARTPPAMETTNNLDRAIDRLVSPEGEAEIAAKITALETERDRILEQIAKLRRLQKSLGIATTKTNGGSRRYRNADPTAEAAIIKHLSKVGNKHGIPAGEIANSLNLSKQKVGITAAASTQLVSHNGRIALA